MTEMEERTQPPMAGNQETLEEKKIIPEQTMQQQEAQELSMKGSMPPPTETQKHAFTFSGQAGEYFRIWITNLFLSIITLGIYAAWAKVRTRRYFYTQTRLAGHVFEYLASPGAILKGNLIIGGGILLYNLGNRFSMTLSLSIMVVFALVFPFLVYKSLRFFSHNSSFRNIRFRFVGTLKESYINFLFYPLLIPLTLGLIMPYWAYRRKRYFFDNLAFGATTNRFTARPGYFYRIYGISLAMIFGIGLLAALGNGVLIAGLLSAGTKSFAEAAGPLDNGRVLAAMLTSYAIMLVTMTVVQQYLYVRTTNYCWGQAELGPLSFVSTLKVKKLVGISIGNLLAIILSLGLMVPWAKIRRTRYILDNLTIHGRGDLDTFHAAAFVEENAIGDAAADFFDFDIAL
jgi:uncharacterized membrane protein YjgN (DUF898 family)